MTSTTRKTSTGNYEVTFDNRTFRVCRKWDGEMSGLWVVTEQNASLKADGVDHWFQKGVEESKRDAIRLIENGYYAN